MDRSLTEKEILDGLKSLKIRKLIISLISLLDKASDDTTITYIIAQLIMCYKKQVHIDLTVCTSDYYTMMTIMTDDSIDNADTIKISMKLASNLIMCITELRRYDDQVMVKRIVFNDLSERDIIEYMQAIVSLYSLNIIDSRNHFAVLVANLYLSSKLDVQSLKQLTIGPVFDGDVISKAQRDSLLKIGLCIKVANDDSDSSNGTTSFGYTVHRYIEMIIKQEEARNGT